LEKRSPPSFFSKQQAEGFFRSITFQNLRQKKDFPSPGLLLARAGNLPFSFFWKRLPRRGNLLSEDDAFFCGLKSRTSQGFSFFSPLNSSTGAGGILFLFFSFLAAADLIKDPKRDITPVFSHASEQGESFFLFLSLDGRSECLFRCHCSSLRGFLREAFFPLVSYGPADVFPNQEAQVLCGNCSSSPTSRAMRPFFFFPAFPFLCAAQIHPVFPRSSKETSEKIDPKSEIFFFPFFSPPPLLPFLFSLRCRCIEVQVRSRHLAPRAIFRRPQVKGLLLFFPSKPSFFPPPSKST